MAFKKILKNKKGAIYIIYVGIVVSLFLPLCAAVIDISNMRMYTQDLNNIAQMAVLSCQPRSDNRFDNSCKQMAMMSVINNITKIRDSKPPANEAMGINYGVIDNVHPNGYKYTPIGGLSGRSLLEFKIDPSFISVTSASSSGVDKTTGQSYTTSSKKVVVKAIYHPIFLKFKTLISLKSFLSKSLSKDI